MASAAWHLCDIVRLSRWNLGGSQRFLTEGITWFQHLHEHLPTGGALRGHNYEFVGMSNKFNFVVAAQPQGQASAGLAGSDSCLSCRFRPRALPHRPHRWHSGAEVLALHLSDASLMANPHKTALTQPAHLGAVHLVQSVAHFLHRRALRRVCSDGKADPTRGRCE